MAHASSTVPAALLLLLAALPLCAAAQGANDRIERGRYLVNTSGCNDCHTPWKMGANGPEPDMTRFLSGHQQSDKLPAPPKLNEAWIMASSAANTAHAGPWGVSYTGNLTPDADTGLGRWSEADFIATFRTGKRMGRGRDILPPMPIPAYGQMNDADLGAIYAYLRTITPIRNKVPEPLPPAAAAR